MKEILKKINDIETALERIKMSNTILGELKGHHSRLYDDLKKLLTEIRQILKEGNND